MASWASMPVHAQKAGQGFTIRGYAHPSVISGRSALQQGEELLMSWG